MLVRTLIVFFSMLTVSCQSSRGIVIREVSGSLTDARVAIVRVIGEPRWVSQNGRELSSEYYDEFDMPASQVKNLDERRYSHVIVLGDRRPYDVQVEVRIEAESQGRFVYVGNDKKREQKLSEKIRKSLHQSTDKRNLIDDFRPF